MKTIRVSRNFQPIKFDIKYFGWVNGTRVVDPNSQALYYQHLVDLLDNKKSRLRWSAADQLGKFRYQPAVKPLIGVLNDPHWLVRLHAAKALGCIDDKAAVPPLVNAINDENDYVRRRVVFALGHFIEEYIVFDSVVLALNDTDKVVRANAVKSLSNSNRHDSIKLIAQAVMDEDINVSWRAIEVLEKFGVRSESYLLDLLLQSRDAGVLYRVIKTLGYIGDIEVIGAIKQFLDHPNERVSLRAEYAVRQIRYRQESVWR